MKCFEKLVMAHINTIIPETLDLLQFAYRPNRSTDDAISIALHTALSHMDKRNTYVRMLFIDYSSAFNTIVPAKLITKLRFLGLNTSLCNWILDFLTGRPQVVRVGNNTSTTLILNTGAPQGCMLSPLLYSLFTHDYVAKHDSNTIIKFANDTTVVGLITNKDETGQKRGHVKP
jgi:gmma-aminobutyric acid receptor subunit gamma/cGMP-dependent protein kinase 2